MQGVTSLTVPSVRAVVTGGTRGLGRGLAAALGARGCAVTIASQSAAESASVAAALSVQVPTGRFFGARCDVRDPAQVDALAETTRQSRGGIDLWINNAGLALTGTTIETLSPDSFATMVDVNLRGTMHGCRSALRAMQESGGTIVNVHGAGSDGKPVLGMIGYATTKRAVQFFTKALAQEVAGGRVIVAGISPGLVLTEGFFREHAKTPLPQLPAREAMVNILADDVATVAQWAAAIMLGNMVHGREYRWLTPAKIRQRATANPPRDVLTPYRDQRGPLAAAADRG